MTVHVFDEDVSKRFILINALRYGEGEETREGIRVERIIPEGAVLSYLGNPFFVRR
jgi:general secretion pathway protein B